ncbi:hypothetical protein PEG85_11830 [Lactococcus cremoris]|uniref:hypothetical protein n=1 Tax=Lactococcus lactis subsp. cremoris TaxID=1359 RepID=UPI0022E56A69|nr:hypothetical protein [Lactococcus cremoris]MDA2881606.1 hypothetical protein [Lactococcus cremoris]MDA2884131.1 hypothetical protein [Lactococcus cremoris]
MRLELAGKPKLLSKRELELQEVKYIYSLRAERDELKEQLNTAKKNIKHLIGTIKHDGHLGTVQTDWILPDLEKALAEIGGDR